MAHSESRSNDLGRPAIRAGFFCPIDRPRSQELYEKAEQEPNLSWNGKSEVPKIVIFLSSSGGRSLSHLLHHHVDVVAYAFNEVIAQFAD
jgi:hypothetical protein